MTGEVLKVFAPKKSRNGNIYIRITFQISDDKWAKTDVCPSFRNYKRWKPIIKAGKGTIVSGLTLRKDGEINADSWPGITTKAKKEHDAKKREEKEFRRGRAVENAKRNHPRLF